MIKDEATPFVTDIAKAFITLVREIEPQWQKAYLRVCSQSSAVEAKASYSCPSGTKIVDVLSHKDFFHPLTQKGRDLFADLGKDHGLFLLVVDSDFNCEIQFEYHDFDKWRISKLNGGTGVPEGLGEIKS